MFNYSFNSLLIVFISIFVLFLFLSCFWTPHSSFCTTPFRNRQQVFIFDNEKTQKCRSVTNQKRKPLGAIHHKSIPWPFNQWFPLHSLALIINTVLILLSIRFLAVLRKNSEGWPNSWKRLTRLIYLLLWISKKGDITILNSAHFLVFLFPELEKGPIENPI